MDKDELKPSQSEECFDTLLEVAKTSLPLAFPVAGSIIAFLLGNIPKSREKRLYHFVEELFRLIQEYKIAIDHIDKRIASNKEQLEYIVEKVISTAMRDKIALFAAIFLNEINGYDIGEQTKEYLINIIETKLTTLHIWILSFMYKPIDFLIANSIDHNTISGGFGQMFSIAFPGIDTEIVKAAYKDLFNQGFISTDVSIFSTMTSGSGLSLLGDRVNKLGKILIDYCSVRKNA